MTEEELRKQATSTIEWENTPLIDRPLFVHAYITSAKPRENRIEELERENAELKAKIEKLADCSNCKHWHYSSSLVYVCDCSDKISDSIDSVTYEHCDKWELAE